MNEINKTLYIPLYGKAFVSNKNIILKDKKAEMIWNQSQFKLKSKSKSKWLAYFMAMRSALFDEWVKNHINEDLIVLHIGCGLDSRNERINNDHVLWYDIDFEDVINERKKYYKESDHYFMKSFDMREKEWMEEIDSNKNALIILEGVSMYFKEDELKSLFNHINKHFTHVNILMDVYSNKAAKLSKYKNPINDVGVNVVYGYDNPSEIVSHTDIKFIKEHNMTPQKYIDQLNKSEKTIFTYLFAGRFAKTLYKTYEYKK